MPGSQDTRACLGTALVAASSFGDARAPSLPRRLCLQCGSNYRNVEKRHLPVGKHFSRQASAGSCRAGIQVGARPLHPTPPTPNPHPISQPYPLARCTCTCLGQPHAGWVIISCADYNSLCRLLFPALPGGSLCPCAAGAGRRRTPLGSTPLLWKSGGFPLIPQGVGWKERWGKEQTLKNTQGGEERAEQGRRAGQGERGDYRLVELEGALQLP